MKIFISYRREDSAGYTGRLYDSLRTTFGDANVFLDVSGIDSGRKFADVIQGAIHTCDVLLAVIGPDWATCTANGRRRLDDPQDLVRTEIVTALDAGIPVIPVLVGGAAPVAAATMPAPLQPLAAIDAHDMTDERWAFDSERLIAAIQKVAGRNAAAPGTRLTYSMAAGLLALAVLTGGYFVWRGRTPADTTIGSVTTPTVAGDWQAEVTYDWGAKYTEKLSLQVDGTDVLGTASFLGVARGINNGTLDGDRLTFETRTQEFLGDERRDVVHRYRGRIRDNSITLTMQSEGGSSPEPIEFTATRP